MPNYSGIWSLPAQYQAVGNETWTGLPLAAGDIGMFLGGTGHLTTRGYIYITSTGNEVDFGDIRSVSNSSGCGSSTRGIIARTDLNNSIDYITIRSAGDRVDFGDRTTYAVRPAALSNETRAVFCGQSFPTFGNTIDYITIASTGNATDFGDAVLTIVSSSSGCGSTTRGLIMGGETSPNDTNVIQYITFASAGDATDFGDLTESKQDITSVSNSTRAVRGGGVGDTNVMDYVTIASTGNATDFGDLSVGRTRIFCGNCSNSTRGIFAGGDGPAGDVNLIEYITIASTGNASDFGDMTSACENGAQLSNVHGGLA